MAFLFVVRNSVRLFCAQKIRFLLSNSGLSLRDRRGLAESNRGPTREIQYRDSFVVIFFRLTDDGLSAFAAVSERQPYLHAFTAKQLSET
jgi:hypothetical protein